MFLKKFRNILFFIIKKIDKCLLFFRIRFGVLKDTVFNVFLLLCTAEIAFFYSLHFHGKILIFLLIEKQKSFKSFYFCKLKTMQLNTILCFVLFFHSLLLKTISAFFFHFFPRLLDKQNKKKHRIFTRII